MKQEGRVIIETRDLTKKYGNKTAVNHLNLSVHEGEVFGLLGPNGAGKTTTILMLLGLTEPTGGQAVINGMDCTRNPIGVKSIVGYLPDNVGFYGDMTGRQNLRFTGRLNGIPEKELDARIDSVGACRHDCSGRPEDQHLFQRYAPASWCGRCPDERSTGDHHG